MRSDEEIKRDVEAELRWDPDIDPTDIGVAVKNGVVTLTGFVKSYNDKWEAERNAKRVSGVLGVANDLEVRLPNLDERPDPEIARDAVAAIKAQLPVSYEQIKVVVKNGWISLEGEVEWNYQREAAERAVGRLRGVKGVSNKVELKPRATPGDQAQDRAGVSAQRGDRREPRHGRGAWRRGHPERFGAVLGRASGGGTRRLGGAGGHQGRQPDHHQRVAPSSANGRGDRPRSAHSVRRRAARRSGPCVRVPSLVATTYGRIG
jgi:osmotically-inducible protein OsmY